MNNIDKIIVSNLNKTWILDLDGTIVKHNGYKLDNKDTLLEGALDFFNKIDKNDMIIFITSRKKEYKEITEKFLTENNIRYDYIIFDAPYGERILINDRKASGMKTAIAVNTTRDIFLKEKIEVDENI